MSSVGQAPWDTIRRRTTRAAVNPLDKATVFSIYPIAIHETKITLQPGVFDIAAGSYDEPSSLVVGPSSWWRELSLEEPLLEIPVSAILIAESVVRDYCNGLDECNMNDRMPGIFFLPGTVSVTTLQVEYKSVLDRANQKQRNWYEALVNEGDMLWSRTNGNPLAISNIMRIAASALGMEKDWLKNYSHMNLVKCKACSQLNPESVVVCPNCKVVLDQERFDKMGLVFAK